MIADNTTKRSDFLGSRASNASVGAQARPRSANAPSVLDHLKAEGRNRARQREEAQTKARENARRAYRRHQWTLDLGAEGKFVAAALSILAVTCILGVVFLGAYMRVAYQGRQIDRLHAQIRVAEARRADLLAEIAQKEAPGRVSDLAEKHGMVMGDKAEYVDVPGGASSTSTSHKAAPQTASIFGL
jgi:cell division protein FtsL